MRSARRATRAAASAGAAAAIACAGWGLAIEAPARAAGDPSDAASPAAELADVPNEYLADPAAHGFVLDLHGDVLELHATVERLAGGELLFGVEPDTIRLGADVFFEFDEAALTDEAERALDELIDEVRDRSDTSGAMQIVGHTDNVGDAAYNQTLSEQRAHAVADYLDDALDLGDVDVSVEGRGEDEPIAPNEADDGQDNPEGRARNRRVELRFDGT